MAAGAFRFPVYQIDFSAVAAGKRVAATKRRIRWRFGYPNREALAEGKTGIECRGEEHEVVIVWSVTSGKRQIMMDGKEVHYSMNRTGILDHSWTARGNHILKVACHAAAPMTANPNFRQYDLFIDGQSFFGMPKVYELGLRGGGGTGVRSAVPPAGAYGSSGGYGNGAPSFASSPAANIRAPRDPMEEEEELQRAINASIEESRKHLGESKSVASPAARGGPPTPSGDLLSMDAGPNSPGFDTMSFASAPPANYYSAPAPYPAASTPQYSQQQPPTPQYSQPPQPPTPTYPSSNAGAASFPALPPSNSYPPAPQPQQQQYQQPAYGAAPPAQPAYGQPPPPAYRAPAPPAYAPAPVVTQSYSGGAGADPLGLHTNVGDDPFAPKPPSHSDIANEILSAYSATSPTSTMGPGQSFESPGSQGAAGGTPQANGGMANNMNMMALVEVKEEEPLNPFDAAVKKLVNIDRIDEPAEEQMKLTMKKEEDKTASKNKGKSRGLPPVAKGQVGSQATLSQISTVKTAKAKREDIMNAPPQLFHPDAAAAGMLVVHGQHPQQNGGPPPLQQQGFGVGYQNAPHMGGYGGGYGGYR